MANTTTAAATTTARLHHHHHQQQQLLIRSYQRDGYFSRNVVYGRSTTTKNRECSRCQRRRKQKPVSSSSSSSSYDDDLDEEVSSYFKLILMRHSKADNDLNKYARDIDRPLTEEGKFLAKELGMRLFEIAGNAWEPTRAICSSARRTRETLKEMNLTSLRKPSTIAAADDDAAQTTTTTTADDDNLPEFANPLFLGSVYHYAGMDGVFAEHVSQIVIGESETFEEPDGTSEVVLIVGHNKGLEEAVREFTGVQELNMNVASLACLRKKKTETRKTWADALEENASGNDNKSHFWELVYVLDPDGECGSDCGGWGDVERS
jgi:phosphohistidine phosphatase SixA